jgi:hypothetical protein
MAEGNPMPEFTVKEVRLPELHLPEIKRDEIVRTLSGVRLPDVDLAKARRASMKVPAVAVSRDDIGRIVAGAAAIARLTRPGRARSPWVMPFVRRSRSPIQRIVQPRRRRSRWPLVAGGIVVLLVGAWAVLRRPDVRLRIDATVRQARTRLDAMRGDGAQDAMIVHEPVALASADLSAGNGTGTTMSDPGTPSEASDRPDDLDVPADGPAARPAVEESTKAG